MATKNIVPNADGEGQLGTSSKSWAQGHIDSITGTIATAAQGSITSLGTLTTLTVDNVIINGTTIGHTSDTDLLTLASASLTVAGNITLNVASDSNPRITFDGAAVDDGHYIQVNRSTEAMEFYASDVTVLTLDTSSVSTFAGNLKIPDSGTIGCASDTDLLTLASASLTVAGKLDITTSVSGFASTITNNKDDSQGVLIRTSDNDGGEYILDLQSSSSATGTDYASKFRVAKGGNIAIPRDFNDTSRLFITTGRWCWFSSLWSRFKITWSRTCFKSGFCGGWFKCCKWCYIYNR